MRVATTFAFERIEAPVLVARPRVAHGFLSRGIGVGPGLYDGLNCGLGSDDDPDRVRANRARAAESLGLGADALITPYQTHSPDCVIVQRRWAPEDAPRADALVTNDPDTILGVATADCAPVLLADSEAGVVGAAHAGWRGALTGVLEATLEAMEKLGARVDHVLTAVGPCIGRASYEVGPEFLGWFVEVDPKNERFFRPRARTDRLSFDLEGYVLARLARAGVAHAEGLGLDTFADPGRFFSYRRTTRNKLPDYGRMLSVIRVTG